MDNKGFTVVELIVSFSVTLIVVILLFNIILDVRNIYINDGIKTELLIKQSLINDKVVDAIYNDELTTINRCEGIINCYNLTYTDGSQVTISVDKTTNIFQVGEYKTELISGSIVGNLTIVSETYEGIEPEKSDSLLILELPITHELVEGNYNVYTATIYNSSNILVNS